MTIALIFAAIFYLYRWLRFRKSVPFWRAESFLAGLVAVWLAAGSPLAMLDEELLTAHMAQHLLLLTIGPALILLGFPAHHRTPKPLLCWFAGTAVLIGWHIPAVFALAFRSMTWHSVEQATFLAAGMLFWQPVIGRRAEWPVVIYLFTATLPCDALSAFLAFCGRVVYPAYLNVPRHFGLSALEDQECAGALMWTGVTLVYLIPAMLITYRLLSSSEQRLAPKLGNVKTHF